MSVLDVQSVSLRFGGLSALKEVSFQALPQQVTAVIGPNGAGKTSLFNVVTGLYEATEGKVLIAGKEAKRSLKFSSLCGLLLIALLAAVLLVFTMNAQSLWEASISSNYLYRQEMHWGAAWQSMFSYFKSQEMTFTVIPFLGGFVIAFLGSLLVWGRAKAGPEVVAQAGVSRTFQNIRLFQQMTVIENVLLGLDRHLNVHFWDAALRLPRHFKEERKSCAKALEILEFVGLESKAYESATSLPYGHQRRLEIARALALEPVLLLLDEPAAGMNPAEGNELVELIRKIIQRGITVILIEHHMQVVMDISDKIVVLDYGNKIAEGSPEEIRANPKVIEAYLGSGTIC